LQTYSLQGFFHFMTVYQLAILFEKKAKHNLAQGHIMILGGRIKKAFIKTYPGHILPIVTSVERKGTFKSFENPDHSISRREKLLAAYVEDLKAKKAKKFNCIILWL